MDKRVYFLQEIIPNYRVPLLRRLAGITGIDLTVFYSEPNEEQRRENLKNATDMSGFSNIKLRLSRVFGRNYQFSFIRHLIFRRPDVVISGKPGCLDTLIILMLCRIIGVRLYWFSGGVPFKDNKRIKEIATSGRLERWFGRRNPRRWMVNHADGMIVYSDHAKYYYSSLGFPEEKIWVAPNSPDTDHLLECERNINNDPRVIDELRSIFSPNNEKIVLMLGRLNKARKTDVLLAAFRRVQDAVPDARIVIVGDGVERASLEAQTRNNGIKNVYFVGAIYDDELMAPYFMMSDVFVTPGVASLALKIAMTFGCPVITADHGLEVHAVDEGVNGFVVDTGDVDELAARIQDLLMNDALRENMSRNAKNTILEKINITKMVAGFVGAINADN